MRRLLIVIVLCFLSEVVFGQQRAVCDLSGLGALGPLSFRDVESGLAVRFSVDEWRGCDVETGQDTVLSISFVCSPNIVCNVMTRSGPSFVEVFDLDTNGDGTIDDDEAGQELSSLAPIAEGVVHANFTLTDNNRSFAEVHAILQGAVEDLNTNQMLRLHAITRQRTGTTFYREAIRIDLH